MIINIHPGAVIHHSARIHKSVEINAYVVIGADYIHCHKKQHSIYYGKYESSEKTTNTKTTN